MSTLASPLLTGREVCALAGITYRQLDYWCRMDVLTPEVDAHGSGSRRAFTRPQARALAVCGRVAELAAGGGAPLVGTLSAVFELLDLSEGLGDEEPGWVVIADGRPRVVWLADELADAVRSSASAVVIAVPPIAPAG